MEGIEKPRGWFGVVLILICAIYLCTGQYIWKLYDGLLPLVIGFGIYGLGVLAMLSAYRFGSLFVLQPIGSIVLVV